MPDRVGEQFSKYQLLKLLGRGATSHVYLGKHSETGAEAAIKILDIQLSPERTDAFLAEGQKLTRLNHPNIRRTLAVGLERQTPFLVLEYVPKGTLRSRYPEGERLSPTTILPYVRQIAEALHYTHKQRVIHGDIKPENLLTGEHNQILVNDFSSSLITLAFNLRMSQFLGTVNYIAPEQFEGKPRPASDQYSLAVVIYEWLCGELPFQGSLLQIISAQLLFSAPSLREKNPAISEAVENVIMTALAKDWRERYASIQGFAKAFEHACQSDRFVTSKASEIASIPPTDIPSEAEPALPAHEPITGAPSGSLMNEEPIKVAGPVLPISPKRTTTFISYSHIDKLYLEELHPYLKPLERDGTFDFWDDTRLIPSANWREEIHKAIESARIAICLVSADFLASEFITQEELPLLLAAREAGAIILPVVVRHCPFELSPLHQFQIVNEDINRPLSEMLPHERDKVWTKLVRLIHFTLKTNPDK